MSRWLSGTEELPPGTMLHGRYEIKDVVGSGGNGDRIPYLGYGKEGCCCG